MRDRSDIFKEMYEVVSNQYRLYYDIMRSIDSRFDYLLLFNNLILVVYIMLFPEQLNPYSINFDSLYYIPVTIFMIAIMGLFIHIWPTKFWFHWIERNRLKKLYDDKDDVYFHALEDMYGTVPHLRKYAERKSKIVKWLTMITAIAVLASLFVITFDADMYIWSTIIMTISPLIMAALYKLWNAPNLKYDPGIENGAYFKKWREEHKK